MLDSLDAEELNDWRTFELSEGPLDRSYDREVAVQTLEHIKILIHVASQHSCHKENCNLSWTKVGRPYIQLDVETPEEKAEKEEAEKQATVDALNLMISEA